MESCFHLSTGGIFRYWTQSINLSMVRCLDIGTFGDHHKHTHTHTHSHIKWSWRGEEANKRQQTVYYWAGCCKYMPQMSISSSVEVFRTQPNVLANRVQLIIIIIIESNRKLSKQSWSTQSDSIDISWVTASNHHMEVILNTHTHTPTRTHLKPKFFFMVE